MVKPKYQREEVLQIIEKLYNQGPQLTYEELMREHKKIIFWVGWRLKDDEKIQEKLKEIKRHSLFLSVRKLSETESVKLEYIQDKHPGLERVARQIYSRDKNKSPWQLLIEDAGIKYPCREKREWDLKKLLEKINFLYEKTREINYSKFYDTDAGFVGATHHLIRGFGKTAILAGIDYLKERNIHKRICRFEDSELIKIMEEESLSMDEKVRSIFNALSLQYYPLEDYKSRIWRILNKENSFRTCQENLYFQEKFGILFQQNKNNLLLYRVSMNLNNVSNRFQNTNFYFSGKNSCSEALLFYKNLENILKRVDESICSSEI